MQSVISPSSVRTSSRSSQSLWPLAWANQAPVWTCLKDTTVPSSTVVHTRSVCGICWVTRTRVPGVSWEFIDTILMLNFTDRAKQRFATHTVCSSVEVALLRGQRLKLTGDFLAVAISPGKRGRYRTDCIR